MHPLSRFPGPPSGVADPILYAYHLIDGSLVEWIQSLHEKYEEIVRIHPDEFSLVDPSAWHDIYVTRPLLPRPKITIPDIGTNAPDMSACVNTEDHQRMRKAYISGFAERALKKQKPLIQKHTDLLIKRLQDLVKVAQKASQEVDILEWYSFVLFDIIGDLPFGESFHALETSEHNPWVEKWFTFVKISVRLSALRHFGPILDVVKWCTPNSIGEKAAAHMKFTQDKVDKPITQISCPPFSRITIKQGRLWRNCIPMRLCSSLQDPRHLLLLVAL